VTATFRRLIRKVVRGVLDRPLPPPSADEQGFLAELKATFRNLPVLETRGLPESDAMWRANMNRLREVVLDENPREFLRSDVVSKTMSIAFAGYILQELRYLKGRPDWAARWRAALQETTVGHPVPYVFSPRSSATLIHHAHHVAQFEAQTRRRVDNLELIVEFGGGYGSMCRLLHRLGFSGKYIIFDLPPFCALQRYFLRTLGLPVKSPAEFVASKAGIVCVSSSEDLQTVLAPNAPADHAMFLATWSLSEAPVAIRDAVLPHVSGCECFLLAYQDRFGEVDNVGWFRAWQESKTGVAWSSSPIGHLPGNYYLFGRREPASS
jgi:hypothetical protein